MSPVARWIIYYVASALLIIGLHAFAFYLLGADEPLFSLMALAFLEGIMMVLIIIFQLAIILVNLFSEKAQLRFLAAFSCLYAIAGVFFYVICCRVYDAVINAGDMFEQEYGVPKFADHPSPYFHVHLLLLLPLVLQMSIFGMYYRKNKKAKLSIQHGTITQDQAPAS